MPLIGPSGAFRRRGINSWVSNKPDSPFSSENKMTRVTRTALLEMRRR